MSSPTDEWRTPRWLFDELNQEFDLRVDACATPENALCPEYWTLAQDCKKQDWTDKRVFINPPYSQPNLDQIIPYCGSWVAEIVVAIIPATPNTKWFHKYIWDARWDEPRKGVTIRFPTHRIAFIDPISNRASPRHDTMIIVWDRNQR